MVMAAVLLSAALQSASPVQQAEICTLVTPRGDSVRFAAMPWSDDGNRVGLVPAAGSVWPPQALAGDRNAFDRNPQTSRRFIFGDGHGVVFELGDRVGGRPQRSATLFRRAGDGAGLPLAFGFCTLGPAPDAIDAVNASVEPTLVGANIRAFDPRTWPDGDCALLTHDGRPGRVRYRVSNPIRGELSGAGLWSGGRVDLTRRQGGNRAGGAIATFGHPGGPSGAEILYIRGNPPQAVRLVTFSETGEGSDASPPNFAICGAATLVRRAS